MGMMICMQHYYIKRNCCVCEFDGIKMTVCACVYVCVCIFLCIYYCFFILFVFCSMLRHISFVSSSSILIPNVLCKYFYAIFYVFIYNAYVYIYMYMFHIWFAHFTVPLILDFICAKLFIFLLCEYVCKFLLCIPYKLFLAVYMCGRVLYWKRFILNLH